ncbi:MAG TPA: hypothetical protein PLH82_00145 [Candidatus Paceibacterota bacterium]|nr:hypothetical protein [Candidatus Paceibacterota bacterium]HRV32407.1 hypothetical protein [Candidatus Paceibacterota bacterium]
MSFPDNKTMRIDVTKDFNPEDNTPLFTLNNNINLKIKSQSSIRDSNKPLENEVWRLNRLYLDNDNSNTISNGDICINTEPPACIALEGAICPGPVPYGLVNCNTNYECGRPLYSFTKPERIKTTNPNGNYIYEQDGLYLDNDNNNKVSDKDLRMSVGDSPAEGSDYCGKEPYSCIREVTRDVLTVYFKIIGHTGPSRGVFE